MLNDDRKRYKIKTIAKEKRKGERGKMDERDMCCKSLQKNVNDD